MWEPISELQIKGCGSFTPVPGCWAVSCPSSGSGKPGEAQQQYLLALIPPCPHPPPAPDTFFAFFPFS